MAAGEIIAMGGGGFLMEPENPLLDDFILGRARRQPARVCFVPTASGDSAGMLVRFYRAFVGKPCAPSDLTLHDGPIARQPLLTADLADFVGEQDVIYVGGGNTANLLAVWRTHGLDTILRTAWAAGTVLCGVSAGMLCWFTGGVTDSFGGLAPLYDGLGLVPESGCPHYDHPGRRDRFHALIASGAPAGYAADDGVALCFTGAAMTDVIASRPNVAGYRIERRNGAVVEDRLPARRLTG